MILRIKLSCHTRLGVNAYEPRGYVRIDSLRIPKEISLTGERVSYKHKAVVRFCHLLYSLCNN